MNHSFNVEVAKVAGVIPATIFNCIGHWVEVNAANNNNFFDGKTWVYNTVDAWSEIFPYATKKQIEKSLTKLRDAGLIESASYNEDKRDRTLWYALTPIGSSIYRGLSVDEAGGCNSPNGEPSVPNGGNDSITTIGIPVSKQESFSKLVKDVISYLNEKTGKKFRTSSKATRSYIHARMNEGYTLSDFKHVIDVKASQWLNDKDMNRYLQPSTLFGPKFEGYVNESASREREQHDYDAYDYAFTH